jgi:type IV fimbrial biogenesis protein FimT
MRSFGFTLIDLLITLSILVILLAVGLPNFSTQIKSSRVNTATLDLQEAIVLTRTTAISTNNRTTMAKQADWKSGWEIFLDTNNNGVRDQDETTLLQHEELKGVSIIANGPLKNNVSYIGTGESRNASGTNGGGFQAGTFTICPTEKGTGFELTLARGGRVRKSEISIQACEAAKTK